MPNLTRREFVAATAALAVSPMFVRGADEPLILGTGEHRYECIHDWPQLPEQIVWGITHGVAVDRDGNVHVLHTSRKESPSHDTVAVFDRSGTFIRSWGEQFFGSAHGFDLVVENGEQFFYITDLKRGLFKTTLDGKALWHVEKPTFYDGKDLKYVPSNVAVSQTGDVFYADGYGSWFIHHYDKDGNYKKTFGGPDAGAATTIHPHGLYIDTRGKEPLLVVTENDPKGKDPGRLHAFNLNCEHHSVLPTKVRSPRHGDLRDGLVVVPDLDAVVTLVDEKQQVVAELGDGFTTFEEVRSLRTKPRDQFNPGKFICPHDAAFDNDGSIFVAEWVDVGRVTKLKKV